VSSNVTRVTDSDIDIISSERFHGSILCEHQTGGTQPCKCLVSYRRSKEKRNSLCSGDAPCSEFSLRTTWRRGGNFNL